MQDRLGNEVSPGDLILFVPHNSSAMFGATVKKITEFYIIFTALDDVEQLIDENDKAVSGLFRHDLFDRVKADFMNVVKVGRLHEGIINKHIY